MEDSSSFFLFFGLKFEFRFSIFRIFDPLSGVQVKAQVRSSFLSLFSSPVEHREFVAAGAAAGISVTFGAPIAGVLFALEEGSSFFSHKMMWFSVVTCVTALYVAQFLTFLTNPSKNTMVIYSSGRVKV